ncbi:MAG TPA: hypothetical protein VIQ30_05485 [Pseudonocardia sp.]
MASLKDIRTAVKTTLEAAISGLTVHRTVPGTVNVPCVVVRPSPDDGADFLVAMGRGTDTYRLDLLVLVSRADAQLSEDTLDGYVTGAGPSSIRQAIFTAKTLGLADTDAHVAGVSGYGATFEAGGVAYSGAALRLVVHTKGTE